MKPETRYAKSGDVNIAYQVVGSGRLDLVLVPGGVSHAKWCCEEPGFARFLRSLASFSRLIHFVKRGTGLSDRVANDALPTQEERMDDLRAVMDEVESVLAALLGFAEAPRQAGDLRARTGDAEGRAERDAVTDRWEVTASRRSPSGGKK